MNEKVFKEVKKAYSDCWMTDWEKSLRLRQLIFRASQFVTPKEAKEILTIVLPTGYENFTSDLLDLFPDDCEIVIAREYSVCLYVKGKNLPSMKALKANEYDEKNGEIRIWWD